jgi:hypothetical protein
MARALMLTNVLKVQRPHVDMMQFVRTQMAATHALAQLDTTAILITDYVRQHFEDVHRTKSVDQTRIAYNLANVFVHRHSLSTKKACAAIHANDSRAELMQNAHQLIHHNVCAKLDSRAIRCWAASASTNVQMHLALTVHCV